MKTMKKFLIKLMMSFIGSLFISYFFIEVLQLIDPFDFELTVVGCTVLMTGLLYFINGK